MRKFTLFSTRRCALNPEKGLCTVFFAIVTDLTVNVNRIKSFGPNFCPIHSFLSVIDGVHACYLEKLIVC